MVMTTMMAMLVVAVLKMSVLVLDGGDALPVNSLDTASDYYDDYDEEVADGVVPGRSRNDHNGTDFEKYLDQVLASYYEKNIIQGGSQRDGGGGGGGGDDAIEQMQSDQPVVANATLNPMNGSHMGDYYATMRDRNRDNWVQVLKDNILKRVGRINITIPKDEEKKLSDINIQDIIQNFYNTSTIDEDHITEKIRSYYPSCEIPRNTDQEVWKDENAMNLYFNFEQATEESGINIATATLRLYRLPHQETTNATHNNHNHNPNDSAACDNSYQHSEDDRLIRISIYWYTKSLRKHRVKRKLCDSKVIGESAKWVELSVRPATRAWTRGKNLGLAVLVEDQDGTQLKADKYFKGASCTVGTSTPKPIPTIIIDQARRTNELDRAYGLFGQNTTAAVHSDVSLLPTIDVCTLEFPENQSHPQPIDELRINACNLRLLHEQNIRSAQKDHIERIVSMPGLAIPSSRHIRHQRQHLIDKIGKSEQRLSTKPDPRSMMTGQRIILTNHQLQQLQNNNHNRTGVNR